MKRYVVLNKAVGETPLMAVSSWQKQHEEYRDIPVSYAGRLDPMASGKLLVLIGEECKRQTHYTGLDKEYEVELLLDIRSDTGDALGIVSESGRQTRVDQKTLRSVFKNELGTHLRPYPVFSSKTVGGKPLFLHALSGTIGEITIPEHKETIYSIKSIATERIQKEKLEERVRSHLSLVPRTDEVSKALGANFRIAHVKGSWGKVFDAPGKRDYFIVTIRVVCGSGTYMRSLAGRIGQALGTKALALSIRRTKVGRYIPILNVWSRTF